MGRLGVDVYGVGWQQQRRGLAASWPQMGVPAGLFAANLAVLAFSAWSGDAFLTWGWRIPFLLSVILIVLGLWIRLGVEDSRSSSDWRRKTASRRHPR